MWRGLNFGSILVFSTTAALSYRPVFVRQSSTSSLRSSSLIRGGSSDTHPNLRPLQTVLTKTNFTLYLLPSTDPHLTEYPPPLYSYLTYVTKFSGSSGCAVITNSESKTKPFLVTDGRYKLQGNGECNPALDVVISGKGAELGVLDELEKQFFSSSSSSSSSPITVGLDPSLSSTKFCESLIAMAKKHTPPPQIVFTDPKINPVDGLRNNKLLQRPANPFVIQHVEYAGRTVEEKLDLLKIELSKKQIEEKNHLSLVVTNLDEISYLLNLRTDPGDIDFSRLGISYLIAHFTAENSPLALTLFCDSEKINDSVRQHLADNSVTIKPYNDIFVTLNNLPQDNSVWLDKAVSNYAVTLAIRNNNAIINSPTPLSLMKSKKTESELHEFRACHVEDGAAYAKFASKLFLRVVEQNEKLTEAEIGDMVDSARFEKQTIKGLSFPSIVGVGENGAIVHYNYKTAPPGVTMGTLSKDGVACVLIDSGAHYEGGTTDVTRTWHLGKPSAFYVKKYTQVLRGMIGLGRMKFPAGTPGTVLDVLARQFLWAECTDYGHGTGHGVGASLSVHEGPQGISKAHLNRVGLEKGMVVSNEPGFYDEKEGFGIRIENLMEVTEVKGEEGWMGFEHLTMIPIQRELIDKSVLSKEEIDWIDDYHERVWKSVGALLEGEGEGEGKAWLYKYTRPL